MYSSHQKPMTGQMAGPMAGQIGGAMTGQMAGPMTSPMAGPMTYGGHHIEANGANQYEKPVSRGFVISMNVVNAITQVLLGAVAYAALTYANTNQWSIDINIPWPWPPGWPGWSPLTLNYMLEHIYLCVFGYVILMSNAILTLTPHAGWANSLDDSQRRIIHATMQITGSILAIIGSVLKLTDHFQSFQSAHGIIGIIAMALTILSLISGVLNFLFSRQSSSSFVKTCHGLIGSLAVTLAFSALIAGFHLYFRNSFGNTSTNLAIAATVFALLGLLASSLTRILKRF